jgi:arginyl-tRNA synthetase
VADARRARREDLRLPDAPLPQDDSNPCFRVRYARTRALALLRAAALLGFEPLYEDPRHDGPGPDRPGPDHPEPDHPEPEGPRRDDSPYSSGSPDRGSHRIPGARDPRVLLRLVAEYPLVLEAAAHHRSPERITRHLALTADALLDFQHCVLPKGDEKPSAAHRSRLALAEAAGTVLAGGLSLLGIEAPEVM